MANTDLIIPIVVAAIGLLGTLVSLAFSLRADRKVKRLELQAEHSQTVADLTEKYSQPILVAAYDLQQRLYELVEYPISRQHLSKVEGLDDLKIFTCYLLAQYLVFVHILRTQTGYLSFTENDKLKELRKLMYLIDEEIDRRRDSAGWNVGVWPAARVLVCERMISKRKDDLNDALDGGFGIEVKGFDQFREEWATKFKQPMGYFCQWIDRMLEGRLVKIEYPDAPMRVLQHLLVDLIQHVDTKKAYVTRNISSLKCKRSLFCDCKDDRGGQSLDEALKFRRDSRLNDAGLWSPDGYQPERTTKQYETAALREFDLKEVKEMTYVVDLV